MTDAMTALALQWASYAALIGAVVALGWWIGRKDRRTEETPVTPLDPYRARLERDARAWKRQLVAKRKRHVASRVKLSQFHTGGNGAA